VLSLLLSLLTLFLSLPTHHFVNCLQPYCRAHYPAPGSSEDAKEGLDFEQDKVATEGTYENNPEPEPEQYVGQPDTGEFNAVAGGEEEYAEEEYAEEYAEEEYAEEEYAEEYEEGY
jgi:hypothetical protein